MDVFPETILLIVERKFGGQGGGGQSIKYQVSSISKDKVEATNQSE